MKSIRPLLLLTLIPALHAQISIRDSGASGAYQVNLGSTYTQNFDTLAATGSSIPWINNVTLPGWYADRSVYGPNGAPLSSWGLGNDSDRALGGRNTNWGVALSNDSSVAIAAVSISFAGEQWERSANEILFTDHIFFDYQIFNSGSGGLLGGEWIAVPEATFDSPHIGLLSAQYNGNLNENRTVLSVTLSGLALAPGQEIWLRWHTTNEPDVYDYELAIDDLSVAFTAVPEPASAAALLALAGLAAASLRRPRRT